MNRTQKILLIAGSVAVVGTVGGILISKGIKNRRARKEEEELIKKNKAKIEQTLNELSGTQSGETTTPSGSGKCSGTTVRPTRDSLKRDINNNFSELEGVTLYPAEKSTDPSKGHSFASGISTIRNSPEVNNKTGSFDYSNIIGKISSGIPIGKIVAESYDNHSPSHRWFKVKLDRTMKDCSGWQGGLISSIIPGASGCSDATHGWVRADVVTFKPIVNTDFNCQIKRLCQGFTSKTDESISPFTEAAYKAFPESKRALICSTALSGKSNFSGKEMIDKYKTDTLGEKVFPNVGDKQMKEIYYNSKGNFEFNDIVDELF